jgi:hypothetical protein
MRMRNKLVAYPIRMLLMVLLGLAPEGVYKFMRWQIAELHSTRLTQITAVRRTLGKSDLHGLSGRGKRFVRLDPFREILENKRAKLDLLFVVDSADRRAVYEIAKIARESIIFVGARDMTIPRQTDLRYPVATTLDTDILASEDLLKKTFFTENLDSADSLFRPIPGGIMPRPFTGSVRLLKGGDFASSIPAEGKVAVVSHRVRQGPQWERRRTVSGFAKQDWSDFCQLEPEELSFRRWKKLTAAYPFGFCVEGGGLSPSPKFFELLCMKTIPIIAASSISAIHEELPCVIVSSWEAKALNRKKLENDYVRLAGAWKSWDAVFCKLRSSYWWAYMSEPPNPKSSAGALS